jgi:hypothetical protein
MVGGKIGKKTRFLRESPFGSGNYTQVGKVRSINGPSRTRDAVDDTDMEDTNDDHEHQIPGLKNGGEVSLVVTFRPDDATLGPNTGLEKDFEDGTETNWRVEWPQFAGTPRQTFPGFLTAYEVVTATKELITAAIKLKVTGKVTSANFA